MSFEGFFFFADVGRHGGRRGMALAEVVARALAAVELWSANHFFQENESWPMKKETRMM
jgi:hypothetical protein